MLIYFNNRKRVLLSKIELLLILYKDSKISNSPIPELKRVIDTLAHKELEEIEFFSILLTLFSPFCRPVYPPDSVCSSNLALSCRGDEICPIDFSSNWLQELGYVRKF